MGKTVYRSKIDWWVWAILAFFFAILTAAYIGGIGWLTFLIFLVGFGALYAVMIFGTWYAIEGDDLIVYQFCRPHRFPIRKIKDVKYTTSILASAALSTRRVAIRFTDRSVLRSSMPLEISPRDRAGFIRHLLALNPSITTPEKI